MAIYCCTVALNPNADADTIAMLSEDNDDTVIYNLAQNPSTPDAVLSRLCAKHPNPYVHALVAAHPNISEGVLIDLLGDEDRYVVIAALENILSRRKEFCNPNR